MSIDKKTHLDWTPVEGHQGFYAKAAQAPNMGDPQIRRAVEELKRQFSSVDQALDKRSSDKYRLYGSGDR